MDSRHTGLVNSFGSEVKDRILTGGLYHLNVPNPNLIEQVSGNVEDGPQLHFSLLDGGYIDNTGISLCLHYMLNKYESGKTLPTLVSLFQGISFESNMKELRNLYENDGGMLEFTEKQIFKGKFTHEEEFTKRCNEAEKNQPYCYLHLTATTVKNAFQGVPKDRTVKMVVIIPLAFGKCQYCLKTRERNCQCV